MRPLGKWRPNQIGFKCPGTVSGIAKFQMDQTWIEFVAASDPPNTQPGYNGTEMKEWDSRGARARAEFQRDLFCGLIRATDGETQSGGATPLPPVSLEYFPPLTAAI